LNPVAVRQQHASRLKEAPFVGIPLSSLRKRGKIATTFRIGQFCDAPNNKSNSNFLFDIFLKIESHSTFRASGEGGWRCTSETHTLTRRQAQDSCGPASKVGAGQGPAAEKGGLEPRKKL
jgi:hypothetical protein